MSSTGYLHWSNFYTAAQAGLVTPKPNIPRIKVHIFSNYILFGAFIAVVQDRIYSHTEWQQKPRFLNPTLVGFNIAPTFKTWKAN